MPTDELLFKKYDPRVVGEDLYKGITAQSVCANPTKQEDFVIVAFWRCECGTRVKVIAKTDQDRPRAVQTASCPNCGKPQVVDGT